MPQRFTPSLLDRLIDAAPLARSEPLRPALTLQQLKDAVARDVEALLNARRGLRREALAAHPLAGRSVAAFGLDDFASMSMSSTLDRDAICRAIAEAIDTHEPRLRDVTVALQSRGATPEKLRFAIRATLYVHPLHEPVNFDAVLQTTTQSYAVQPDRLAA